jgi:hypothetical protein
MDEYDSATDRMRLAISHIRVLADLLLPFADLQDADRDNFAQVMHELAHQLDRDLAALERLKADRRRLLGFEERRQ